MMVKLGFVHSSGQIMAIQIGANKIPLFTIIERGIPTYPSSLMGLKLSKAGMIQEFPEIMGWEYIKMKEYCVKKFHDKLKTLNSEKEIIKYIENDLSRYGYKLNMIQKEGHRPKIIK